MQFDENKWLFSETELRDSPSSRDGLDEDKIISYRSKTTVFIRSLAKNLNIPQPAIITAQVYFHRFFARQSFKKHERFLVGSACLFLASKVEEHPVPITAIALQHKLIFHPKSPDMTPGELDHSDAFKAELNALRIKLLLLERILLFSLSFELQVDHGLTFLVSCLKSIRDDVTVPDDRTFSQSAINILNDSLRTDVCLRYPSPKICKACVVIAGVLLNVSSPSNGWLSVLNHGDAYDVDNNEMMDICGVLLSVYNDHERFDAVRTSIAAQFNNTNGKRKLDDADDASKRMRV